MMQQQGAQKVLLSIVPPVTRLLVSMYVCMSLYLPATLEELLALCIPISQPFPFGLHSSTVLRPCSCA